MPADVPAADCALTHYYKHSYHDAIFFRIFVNSLWFDLYPKQVT